MLAHTPTINIKGNSSIDSFLLSAIKEKEKEIKLIIKRGIKMAKTLNDVKRELLLVTNDSQSFDSLINKVAKYIAVNYKVKSRNTQTSKAALSLKRKNRSIV